MTTSPSPSSDEREALHVRLARAALHIRVPEAEPWDDLPQYVRDIWLDGVKDIVGEVEAYGDERVRRALGELYAQRDDMDCPVRKAVYDGLRCTCSRPVAPIPRVDKLTGRPV